MTILRQPQLSTVAAASCWLLFVTACCLPAFWLEGRPEPEPAIGLLLIGWLGLFQLLDGQIDALGWLANPFFLLSTLLTLSRSYRPALASAAVAVAFALTSFLIREMLVNEAGHTRPVVGYGPGFWLWQAAIGLCLIAPAFLLAMQRHRTAEKPTLLEFDAELPLRT